MKASDMRLDTGRMFFLSLSLFLLSHFMNIGPAYSRPRLDVLQPLLDLLPAYPCHTEQMHIHSCTFVGLGLFMVDDLVRRLIYLVLLRMMFFFSYNE